MRCDCGGEIKYKATARKEEYDEVCHYKLIYECNLCGYSIERTIYRYKPENCPHKYWSFEGYDFEDGPHSHEIFWRWTCAQCGKIEKRRQDSKTLGLRKAVQVEDPRVMKTLHLNKHTARFHLGEDVAREFWR